jgi:hypothetical protein
MNASNLKANPGEMEAVLERQELREEEMNVGIIESLEDRYGNQAKSIQDSVVYRQKLSAARKRLIRRGVPAVRKGNIRKVSGKDNI